MLKEGIKNITIVNEKDKELFKVRQGYSTP